MGDLQSLSELYQDKLFRIPDYQRGYAWRKNQLIDFWEDIINLQEERYHYTGLLSLKAVPKIEFKEWGRDKWLVDAGYKAYHIVDGQQRLTTFSILINEIVKFVKNLECNIGKTEEGIVVCYQTLKAIRAKYISLKRPPQNLITTYLFGYEIDNPSAEYLIYKIYEESYSGTVNETYYTKNLKFAKLFFADCLQKLYENNGLKAIEGIFRKLTLQLKFNIHEIEEEYDVFVAFETMNNRGKKLTNLELLKNRLIYLTTLYDDIQLDNMDKRELRIRINEAWKEVYYQLGRNQQNPLSDDEFLKAHWIMYFQYSRRKGDDYIEFLLNKFSSKNIFEKQLNMRQEVVEVNEDSSQFMDVDFEKMISKLKPSEIALYVNSLKDVAQYWFYSYFPEFSDLSSDEKIWIERLNRIGIGYFRPLIAVALMQKSENEIEGRISLYKSIERFIFISFRMATSQSNYKSSDYYRKTRAVYIGELRIAEVTKALDDMVSNDMEYMLTSFMNNINKKFSSGNGFYDWKGLKYLLFEYEFEKAETTGIEKIGWKPFTKGEKNKVTIEHILPQTPTNLYWRNQFRQYTNEEIKKLSGTLGNLLPLSQSVNSALQNDSFGEKKHPRNSGRRGYEDGSHSELEVSREIDWDANTILQRGLKILNFIEQRWNIKFKSEEQKIEILNIGFVNEIRALVPELVEENISSKNIKSIVKISDTTSDIQLDFWRRFVRYCNEQGRGNDIGARKPLGENWYDVSMGNGNYHLFFSIIGKDTLRIGIYIENIEFFNKLESEKELIEEAYGFNLEWYTSRKNSKAKRVIHSITMNLYDKEKNKESFKWLINSFDKLKEALARVSIDTIDNS